MWSDYVLNSSPQTVKCAQSHTSAGTSSSSAYCASKTADTGTNGSTKNRARYAEASTSSDTSDYEPGASTTNLANCSAESGTFAGHVGCGIEEIMNWISSSMSRLNQSGYLTDNRFIEYSI